MVSSKDERTATEWFTERYGRRTTDATRELERLVIGGDWGANGYTTMGQAEMLAERLRLGPGRTLLDIGSGLGWPGLFLAKRTGCDVVLTDLPVEGMRSAVAKARVEGIANSAAVVASARRLPFRDDTFHAIVHTDVLC